MAASGGPRKHPRHLAFHGGDLAVEGGDDHCQGADRGGIGLSDWRRLLPVEIVARFFAPAQELLTVSAAIARPAADRTLGTSSS